MRLTQPTDFELLDALSDGKRNVAANLSKQIGKDRAYVNTRLPVLADQDLLERIGPAEKSGLYEITAKGQAAVEYRGQYGDPNVAFEELLEKQC